MNSQTEDFFEELYSDTNLKRVTIILFFGSFPVYTPQKHTFLSSGNEKIVMKILKSKKLTPNQE